MKGLTGGLHRAACALALCGCLFALNPAHGVDSDDRLNRFKAVFLYHFIDYVQWPPDRAAGAFKLGILGTSPVEFALREISQKKNAGGRPLQIEVFSSAKEVIPCHLLFVTPKFSSQMGDLGRRLGKQGMLVVADAPGMAAQGASINFVLKKGKLKFEVNRESLEWAGIKASAQLLKLAILVPSTTAGDAGGVH
jgi:hypothetical protein